jgi:hypothetical protein
MRELYLVYDEIDFGGTTDPSVIAIFFNVAEVNKFVETLQWGESIVNTEYEILANEVHHIMYDENGIVISDTNLEYKRKIDNNDSK